MSALSRAEQASKPQDTGKIRVMIVDDAVVVRGLLTRWLDERAEIDVIGSFRNGQLALEALDRIDPHIIILDIEMPEMDGLTALPLILRKKPGVQVIMASTLTTRNAEISLKALGLGARDYVPKPEGNRGVTTSAEFRQTLIDKVIGLGAKKVGLSARSAAENGPAKKNGTEAIPPWAVRSMQGAPKLRSISPVTPRLLAIGSSTGGPQALMTVMKGIVPLVETLPVIIAQHMPASFTGILAQHLATATGLAVAEGQDGESLQPGSVYVAPGGKHMVIEGSGASTQIRLNDDPPVNFCKPAVDPMFESAAAAFGSAVLGVVLTGMGNDGAQGALRIAEKGGNVVAQDEETSVVWGMPGAAVHAGAACAVVPLPEMAAKITSIVKGKRR